MELALTTIDRRLGTVEETASGLRERVARLETGQTFLMTMMDQRDRREASQSDLLAEEISAIQGAADQTANDVVSIRSFVDSRKETDAARNEQRRYYRSILVPLAVALLAWAITGNLELVKILTGLR